MVFLMHCRLEMTRDVKYPENIEFQDTDTGWVGVCVVVEGEGELLMGKGP